MFCLHHGHGAWPDHKRWSWQFLLQVFCFHKILMAFYKRQGWQNKLMNVLLDNQECTSTNCLFLKPYKSWECQIFNARYSHQLAYHDSNWCIQQSSNLPVEMCIMQDLLLLQPLQNRTATLHAESDDYTDSPSLMIPSTVMGSQQPRKEEKIVWDVSIFETKDSVMERVQKHNFWKKLQSLLLLSQPSLPWFKLLCNYLQKGEVPGDQGKMWKLRPQPGQQIFTRPDLNFLTMFASKYTMMIFVVNWGSCL